MFLGPVGVFFLVLSSCQITSISDPNFISVWNSKISIFCKNHGLRFEVSHEYFSCLKCFHMHFVFKARGSEKPLYL